MAYFPFFVDVTNLHGLIIGGGNIALEKVERLLAFDAKITLIADRISDEIKKYADRMELIEEKYYKEILEKADYVVAATDNTKLNEIVYSDARKLNLLVNVVDVPDMCDFIFPSVMKKGKLVVGVSTSGAGPQVAIRLRKKIEESIPSDIEEILDQLAEARIVAKETMPDSGKRRKYLIDLANELLDGTGL
ncbi:precorrin-2 dehydrogenase/sirohydrochlorin ferrochelatase family protein [Lachnospira sp.]|uniref:precorrin-2 dehydrogenase/sirohydrochlorin ferrochelatase family protein n=1 Tax=Lachnospira sp. TaxID=2049031 RepID=UPI00257C7287|nr:bifunctional precorrin-2 dehydrogenase/sirohydrochlorin ferrochelatase [Lachnospira sp.]